MKCILYHKTAVVNTVKAHFDEISINYLSFKKKLDFSAIEW